MISGEIICIKCKKVTDDHNGEVCYYCFQIQKDEHIAEMVEEVG
jgi:hypothetical protein